MHRPKIILVGNGRAGKDCGLEYLEKITGLKNAGTTSRFLAKYVAGKLHMSEEDCYIRRHESDEMRMLWYNTGNEIRDGDPTLLIREAFTNGDLTGGIRDKAEIIGCREQELADLIIWVENKRVAKDPTMMFDSSYTDIVIENNGTLEEFYEKLNRLALFAGLLNGKSRN